MKLPKLLLALALVFAASATSAKADNGFGGLGISYLYGYNGFGACGPRSFGPPPPYFSMHPPVYYGQRYTRPYGASPFAAWPQLQANAAYAPSRHVDRWMTINNPYVPVGVSKGEAVVNKRVPSSKPLVIENPYYQPTVRYTQQQVD